MTNPDQENEPTESNTVVTPSRDGTGDGERKEWWPELHRARNDRRPPSRETSRDEAINRLGTGTRRRFLAALSAASAGALAGCSGSSDPTDEPGTQTPSPTTSESPTPESEESGTSTPSPEPVDDGNDGLSDVLGQAVDISGTADSDIDELDVIDHRMARGEGSLVAEGALGIALLVENTGEATADLVFEYSYMLAVYDASDEEMFSDYANGASAPPETNPLDPGASGPVVLIIGAYEPDQIGRYEVTLTCRSFNEGTYCE